MRVATPLTTGAMVRTVRTLGEGAVVHADGSDVLIALTASSRRTARARVLALAHAGLEGGVREVTATTDAQAAAARDSWGRADAELQALAGRTGVPDPRPLLQKLEAVVRDLERQSERAAAAGSSEHTIDVRLADNQQAMFELRAQVARHDQLMRAQVRARQREMIATATRGEATVAARAAAVDATVDKIGHGPALWLAGVLFGLVLIALVAGQLVGRPKPRFRWPFRLRDSAESPAPVQAAARPVRAQPVEQRRVYLHSLPTRERDFYLALDPSPPEDADVASSTSVDLTEEEDVCYSKRSGSTASKPASPPQ